MGKICTGFFLCLIWAYINVPIAAGNPTFILQARQFTTNEGLSNNEITKIVQDKYGYIWISTQNGLNRFNGYSFDVFRMDNSARSSLPGNTISALFIDDTDSLWIGSDGLSLHRPETADFRHWYHIPGDPMSLENNYINAIVNDSDGKIWIASYYGIRILNRETGYFTNLLREESFKVNPATIEFLLRSGAPGEVISKAASLLDHSFNNENSLFESLAAGEQDEQVLEYYRKITGEAIIAWDESSLKSNHIVGLENDSNGKIWAIYNHEGLSCIDPYDMSIRHFDDLVQVAGAAVDQINHILADDDFIWLATSGEGLKKLDIRTGNVQKINLDGESFLQHIRKEKDELWISDNRGVIIYNTTTGEYKRIGLHIPNQDIMTDFIGKYTFRDNQDNLWIGTHHTGVFQANSKTNFSMLKNNIKPPAGNPENAVSSISFDRKNNLWVGYVKGGVEVFDQDRNKKFDLERPDFHYSGTTDVFAIHHDRDDNIWIGSFTGGAEVYDTDGNLKSIYRYDPEISNAFPGNDIRAITSDRKGNIYLAVHGKGIAVIEHETGNYIELRNNPADPGNSLSSDWTHSLLIDHKERLWIGSVGGVTLYTPEENSIKNYQFEEFPRGLINIRCIYEDTRNNLWFGTDNGVVVLDPSSDDYFRINTTEGLSNNLITSIIEDNNNNIWISTKNGLDVFNVQEQEQDVLKFLQNSDNDNIKELITNYDRSDGLLTDIFSYNASVASEGGALYFGSNAGVTYFHPDSLFANDFIPPVIISRLSLFNREVMIDDDTGILKKHISHTDRINLKFSQRVISMEFHALSFIYPEKNGYAYKMEGFDDDWTFSGNRREVTYTNLNPGTYRFMVKASNNSGLWNDEYAVLEIRIKPPLGRTNAAYAFYALLILTLSYLLRRIMQIRTHAMMEVKKAREVDEIKTNFFTDVSHEFRTPLTLIEGPAEKLLKERNKFDWDKDFFQVNLLYRNVQRLKLLITELMEFRKITEGQHNLKVIKGDLPAFITDIKDAFDYLADDKKINFRLKLSHNTLVTWFDPKITGKIVFNLLSNAFKFTPAGGYIRLKFSINRQSDELISNFYAKEYIRIEVSDNGPGIPVELREKIFDRYFQGTSPSGKTEGSGIGLALVKELVTLHKGTIQVSAINSKKYATGSSFVVRIPYGEDYYTGSLTDDVFHGADKEDLLKKTIALTTVTRETVPESLPDVTHSQTILIIEDDEEIRLYLKNELESSYHILSASTAEEGLDSAFSEIPDLILSDIMLPGMNGIDFCKTVKTDLKTEHIPVILLTARAENDDRIEGLETGADDFIIKPFAIEELKLRIKNCIQTRIKLRQRFIKNFAATSAAVPEFNSDDRFISRALQIVSDNISNPELDVDFFASAMGMSRAQLYRKFNALTNQTVKEFVRTVRLKKAAELLDAGQHNVSEVAWAVGFGDLPYFTRSFKIQYGINPSKFSQRNTGRNVSNPKVP
ncbi:MAG: two-component regulator propeller domain-containing protein [Bacteroidales bacterium]